MQSGTFKGYNVSDTQNELFPCFGDYYYCYHVIAVDLVLLSCICTKMDLLLLMIAVWPCKTLYACIKTAGQTF